MYCSCFSFFSGLWKKLLGILIFLVAVSLVCGLMLPPNSPYVKKKCREGSIGSNHYFTFKYYPDDGSEVRRHCLT